MRLLAGCTAPVPLWPRYALSAKMGAHGGCHRVDCGKGGKPYSPPWSQPTPGLFSTPICRPRAESDCIQRDRCILPGTSPPEPHLTTLHHQGGPARQPPPPRLDPNLPPFLSEREVVPSVCSNKSPNILPGAFLGSPTHCARTVQLLPGREFALHAHCIHVP